MSLHQCPDCGHETVTNDTVGGAFEVPPTLYCLDCGLEMELLDPDAEIDKEAVPNA